MGWFVGFVLALVLWTLVAEKKEGVPLLALRALDKGEERRRGVREDGGALPPAGGVAGGRLAEEGGAQDGDGCGELADP